MKPKFKPTNLSAFTPKDTPEGKEEEARRDKKHIKKTDTKTFTTVIMCVIGVLVGIPLLIVAQALVYTFVFVTLWDWFMIPLGLMSISFFHAAGISLFFNFILMHNAKHDYLSTKVGKEDDRPVAAFCFRLFAYLVFLPVVFLGFGLIFKNLM